MIYAPTNSMVEGLRRLFKTRVKDGRLAYLGDGTGRTEVPDRKGYYYFRFELSGAPSIARAGFAAFPVYDGAEVYIARGHNGEPEIVGANYARMDQSGIDTRTFNPLHQSSKWVNLWDLTIGLATATATSVTDSFLVSVKKHLTYHGNVFRFFETGETAVKFDTAPFNPGIDEWRYAIVWQDIYGAVGEVTASTTQSLFTPLDLTDINEAVVLRPPDAIPYKAFVLSNNGGTLRQSVSEVDLRQFLQTPQIWGFPNPVVYRERIHPGRQVIVSNLTVTGNLEVLGNLLDIAA